MVARQFLIASAAAATLVLSAGAQAQGTKPVTSGAVIRGVTLPGGGASGTKAAKTCDSFLQEEVAQNGRMTGASVNCGPGGNTAQNLAGLPVRFNAYCVVDARKLKGARLIQAPVPGNANHCDLSAMRPKDAVGTFGGAIWR